MEEDFEGILEEGVNNKEEGVDKLEEEEIETNLGLFLCFLLDLYLEIACSVHFLQWVEIHGFLRWFVLQLD